MNTDVLWHLAGIKVALIITGIDQSVLHSEGQTGTLQLRTETAAVQEAGLITFAQYQYILQLAQRYVRLMNRIQTEILSESVYVRMKTDGN